MKVLLAAHGYPPEVVGGTEKSLQNLARGLARGGVEVVVVAGSMDHSQGFRTSEAFDEVEGAAPIKIVRIHRADLYFDHWQKSESGRVSRAFEEIVARERPDLVHVHHWIRLSRDLVAVAARQGVPAVVTLHDLWTSCLIAFRVRPDSNEFCEATLGPDPCLACASNVPPKTPWRTETDLERAFAGRRADLLRELRLARAVIVPCEAHAAAVTRFLDVPSSDLALRIVPHGRDLELEPRPPLLPPKDHGRLVLGSWGHIHPLKGPDLLLDAVAGLPDPARVEVHFAGGEPDEAYARRVRERARFLAVTLHGPYEVSALQDHPVSAVHAMVSGSRAHESWGLVVDEAVALGLPLVLPRAGAFAERLEEERGALFYASQDPDSLRDVLRRLLDEDGLWQRVRADLPAVSDVAPSLAEHVQRVRAVYDDVLSAGPPSPSEATSEEDREAELRAAVAAEEEWDQNLARHSAEDLGLPT